MLSDSSLFSLILFLLFGGGKDLVSFIPPQILDMCISMFLISTKLKSFMMKFSV